MRMFQSVFIRALLFAGFCTQCLADDQRPGKGSAHPAEASYKLIWQDEFDGDKLDRSKWAPEDDTVIGKYGHGNGESQVYVDAEGETFYVKDGELTIVAIHAPGRKYPVKKEPNGHQKAIGKNACGPCAYVNSLLRSGNKQEPVN